MFPWQIFIMIFSMAYQAHQAAKMRQAAEKAADERRGFEEVVEGQIGKAALVYGRAKVGGYRVWHGISNNFYYEAPLADSYIWSGIPGADGYSLDVRESKDHVETKVIPPANGSLLNKTMTGDANEFLYFQQILCQGGISRVLDVLVDDSRHVDDSDIYTKDAGFWINIYNDGGVADITTKRNFPERATATFDGLAYASVVVKQDREFPVFQATPKLQFLVEGRKVRKLIRSGTSPNYTYAFSPTLEYSNNPATCLLDYLIEPLSGTAPGRNISWGYVDDITGLHVWTQIDPESFYDAAVVCDIVPPENVAIPVGGRFWNPWNKVSLATPRSMPLYECNILIDTEKTMRDNIQSILTTMGDARLVWSSGRYSLNLQYPDCNIDASDTAALAELGKTTGVKLAATITDDHLVQDQSIEIAWPTTQEKYNHVRVRFNNEAEDFKESSVEWPSKYSYTFQRIVGGKYYLAKSAGGTGDGGRFQSTYGVWDGIGETCTLTYKYIASNSGPHLFKYTADDEMTITMSHGATTDLATVNKTSGWDTLETSAVTLTIGVEYLIVLTGRNTNNTGKAVAAGLFYGGSDGILCWSTRSLAYESMYPITYTDTVYKAMLEEDNGLELETEVFAEGVTEFYHAMAKAEELCRTSRSAFKIKFKYALTNIFLEPGDFVKLSSRTLSLEGSNSVIIRVETVKADVDMTCEVTGTRFDYSQLAWSAKDDVYAYPKNVYAPVLNKPMPLVGEAWLKFIDTSADCQGMLEWSGSPSIDFAYYAVYLSVGDLDYKGNQLFIEIGRSSEPSYKINGRSEYSAFFGVRLVTSSGRLSEMLTTNPAAAIVLQLKQVSLASIYYYKDNLTQLNSNGRVIWDNPNDPRITQYRFYLKVMEGLTVTWKFVSSTARTKGSATTTLELSGIPDGTYEIAFVSATETYEALQSEWPVKSITIETLTQTALPTYTEIDPAHPLSGGKLSWAYNTDERVKAYSVRVCSTLTPANNEVWDEALYLKKPADSSSSSFTVPVLKNGGSVTIVSIGDFGVEAPRLVSGEYAWNILQIDAYNLAQVVSATASYTQLNGNQALSGGLLEWVNPVDSRIDSFTIYITTASTITLSTVWDNAGVVAKSTTTSTKLAVPPVTPGIYQVAIVSTSPNAQALQSEWDPLSVTIVDNPVITAVDAIISDSKLSPPEKSGLRQAWQNLHAEKNSLDSTATVYALTAAKTTYDTAFKTLGTYLNGGVSYTNVALLPAWIADGVNMSVSTPIDATVFRAAMVTLLTARTAYNVAIAAGITLATTTLSDALATVTSDGTFSPMEKRAFRQNWDTVYAEKVSTDATAALYGITTEKNTYAAALVTLGTYLNGGTTYTLGTTPPLWLNDTNVVLNTTIDGPTFRSAFLTAANARATYLAVLEAASKTAINTAQSAADAANLSIVAISSDDVLSKGEKSNVKLDYDIIISEQSGIDTQASSYAITTEKTAYDAAVAALTAYLGTLTGWNTIPGNDITIVGSTFRAKFSDVYTTRQTLINKIVAAAKILAESAQTTANAALANAATSQSTADGKIDSFYQATAPASASEGDLWFDTDDGNKIYTRRSGVWVATQDSLIATAISNASTAQGTADGKATVYYQIGNPGVKLVTDGGDIWIDTDDNNKMYVYSHGAANSGWVLSQDWYTANANAATAQITANGKLAKAGTDILSGQITFDATAALKVVTGTVNVSSTGVVSGAGKGVLLTGKGLVGWNGSSNTFAIDSTTGDATFAGALAAATGTFGAVTLAAAGSISSGQTAYNTGTGFWLSGGATPQFSIGNGTKALTWNGTDLTISSTATLGATPVSIVVSGAALGATALQSVDLSGKLDKNALYVLGASSEFQTTGYAGGNGISISNNGLIGKKAGSNTFAIANDGTATFGGALSAVTGTFGAVTLTASGSISAGQTAYNTGTGFWLSGGTTPTFSIGNGTKSLTWNGTDLTISSTSLLGVTSVATVVSNAADGFAGIYTKAKLQTDLDAGVANIVAGVGSNYRLVTSTTSGWIGLTHKDATFNATAAAGLGIRPALTISAAGIIMGYNDNAGAWHSSVAIDSSGNASFAGAITATSGTFVGTISAGSIVTSSVTLSGTGTTLSTIESNAYTGATRAVGDVTATILANSATAITVTSSNLFTMPGTGSGGVFIGAGGLYGKNSAGTETFGIDASTGTARFLGAISSGSTITGATISGGSLNIASGKFQVSTGGYLVAQGVQIQDEAGNVVFSTKTGATANLPATWITPSSGWVNSNISISAGGILSGAGGGTVTIGGLGYTGALNATANQSDLTTNNAIASAALTAAWATVSSKPTEITDGRITTAISSAGLVVSGVKPGIVVSVAGGAGLYLGSDYLGYYSGSAWKTYMDNSGNFYLSGAGSGYLSWTASTSTLTVNGTITGTSTINGVAASTVVSNADYGATRSVGDVTATVLASSGTSITVTSSTLFRAGSGLGGLFIGSGGLFGKNSAGTETFAISATTGEATFSGTLSAAGGTLGAITSGTITGATVQTASSGTRVVLNSSGLKTYDLNGNLIVHIGAISGAISGITITPTTLTDYGLKMTAGGFTVGYKGIATTIYAQVANFESPGASIILCENTKAFYSSSGTGYLGGQLTLAVATGTKPLAITSTTKCDNLNADMLDDLHKEAFCLVDKPILGGFFRITSGTSAQIPDACGLVLFDFAPTSTFTLTMPANPVNGQVMSIALWYNQTALSHVAYAGHTMVAPLVVNAPGGRGARWIFMTTTNSWWRLDSSIKDAP
jgi:hypothetical protein